MKKYFTRALLAVFIVASVFSFGLFTKATLANAQSMDTCGLINLLITIGAVSPEKAKPVLESFGCPVPTPVVSPLKIELISQSIQRSGDEDAWYATGNFKFKATAVDQDVYVYSSQKDSSLDVLKDGFFVGNPSAVALSSTADQDLDYYVVKEGTSEIFTITYIIKPLLGTGFYSSKFTSIILKGGTKVYFGEDFRSNKVYLEGAVISNPVISQVGFKGGDNGQISLGAPFYVSGNNFVSGATTTIWLNGVSGSGDKVTFYPKITELTDNNITAEAPNNLIPKSSYELLVENANGRSNSFKVLAVGQAVYKPTVVITGLPTLDLTYDSLNKEAGLNANFNFIVNSGSQPTYVYNYGATIEVVNQKDGTRVNYGVLAEPVSSLQTTVDAYGQTLYIVPAGRPATFKAVVKMNPKQMFAGVYSASMTSLYTYNKERAGSEFAVNLSVPANRTNYKTIIGEVSPYITYVDSPIVVDGSGGIHVVVKGVRFSPTNNSIIIGSKEFPGFASKNSGTLLDLNLSGMGIPTSGYQNLYVINSDLGAAAGRSNGFTVQIVSTSTQPSITVVSPNGGETLTEGQEYTIKWSNKNIPSTSQIIVDIFQYNGKDDLFGNPNKQIAVLSPKATSYTWTVEGNGGWGIGMNNFSQKLAKLFNINIANANTNQYKISVRAYDQSFPGLHSANDMSDSYFKIIPATVVSQPSLTIVSPNGGEIYKIGDSVKIAWSTENILPTAKVVMQVYKNSSVVYGQSLVNDGQEIFTVPTIFGEGSSFILKLTYTSADGKIYVDKSDDYFTITSNVVPPTPETCSSFTYSDWSTCSSDSKQSREVQSSSPAGCEGGNPVLTQACTYVPVPVITYDCNAGDWMGKDGVRGVWYKPDGHYNSSDWFLCDGVSKKIYYCNAYTGPDTNYWNTFSTRATTGQVVGKYSCDGSNWIVKTTDSNEGGNYATASTGWSSFLKLFNIFR